MNDTVIVGLSGGVDSAVAAWRLLQDGWNVEGLHMVNWEGDDSYCTRADDDAMATAVAQHLGIVLHRANFSEVYREKVFKPFLLEYRRGLTPNPDVLCNRHVKFSAFLGWAERLGASRIATGHYAQVSKVDGSICLRRAVDMSKDQSYFLHAVPSDALSKTLFPLGSLHKTQVRTIAKDIGLPNFSRPDSTGICFIGERPFADFLSEYLEDNPGPVQTETGETLGLHRGLHLYTLGQRAGIGVGGVRGADSSPWYVIGKDLKANTLIISQKTDHPHLMMVEVESEPSHWINDEPKAGTILSVQTRYRQKAVSAVIQSTSPRLKLRFRQPVRAATPGQYAVLYADDICLGGGQIVSTKSLSEQNRASLMNPPELRPSAEA